MAKPQKNVQASHHSASMSPLHIATEKGDLKAVNRLLAQGADLHQLNHRGSTALLFAAHGGHSEVVERLITAGANVNQGNNDGYTPLEAAAMNGHLKIVECLLRAGADINQIDSSGLRETSLLQDVFLFRELGFGVEIFRTAR